MGADASADMIAFAKEHWAAGYTNLQCAVADARHLPFNREFDLIVSFLRRDSERYIRERKTQT
jgi:trans-aconitate 2-methyltransferase